MKQEFREAFFHINNDNLYFRGIDTGEQFDGYACPLFEIHIASTVANYLSPDGGKAKFDEGNNQFVFEVGGIKKYLKIYQLMSAKTLFVEFKGWEWIKDEIKELGT